MATAFTKVQLRRGSAAEWRQYNTILSAGEIGFEDDTYKFKIGQYDTTTRSLIPWNDLDYFGSNFDGQINIDNGDGTPGSGACFNGNVIPCSDDTFTLGEAARRWKNVHASNAIQLGDLMITQGPASEATGEENNFLKVNGDDLATRTELEKKTSANLRLAFPTGDDGVIPIPTYVYALFDVLERELPPTDNIQSQSHFNAWVVEALKHVDDIAHNGNKDDDGNVIIGGPDINVIIGPKPGPGEDPTCAEKLDIYAETTVHCMLDAKKGVKVLGADQKHFVKANGTVSKQLPMEQSYWIDVPRL